MSKSNMRKFAEKKIGCKLSNGEYYLYLMDVEGLPMQDIALLEGVPVPLIVSTLENYIQENPGAVGLLQQTNTLELGRVWRDNYTPEVKEWLKKCFHATDKDVEAAKKMFEKYIAFCYQEGLRP